MLESHGNISILLSEVHELLLCDSPLNFIERALPRAPNKLNEIGAQ